MRMLVDIIRWIIIRCVRIIYDLRCSPISNKTKQNLLVLIIYSESKVETLAVFQLPKIKLSDHYFNL